MEKISGSKIRKIYYAILTGCLSAFLISIPLTHAWSLKLYLWKAGSSFYDFFSCLKDGIYWNRGGFYERGSIYPPLANFFYALVTRCMSIETLQSMDELTDYSKIKSLQECGLYFLVYAIGSALLYYIICTSWKKGERTERTFFACTILLCVPFLYQFERANIIFLALILTMLFFTWKNSEVKWKREAAYLSLALAAGIKLYPAVFGVILLKEKKYRDAFRLVLYGLAAFLLPFFFFGGLRENLALLIQNLFRATDSFTLTRVGCQIDYFTVLKNLLKVFASNGIYASYVLKAAILVLTLFAVWFLKEKWKVILLLTCLLIGIPSISYVYSAVFMVIPVIAYLDSGDKSRYELIYLAGMLLVLIPLPFCWTEGYSDTYYSYMNVSTPVRVEGLSVLGMSVLLLAEGMIHFADSRSKKIISCLILAGTLGAGVFLYRDQYGTAYAYTEYLSKTLSDTVTMEDGDTAAQSFTARGNSLESVEVRLKPAESGTLRISVFQANEESALAAEISIELADLTSGYQKFYFDNCALTPGKQYIVLFEAEMEGETEIKIWRTVDSVTTEGESFEVNGEQTDGALGIRLNECS